MHAVEVTGWLERYVAAWKSGERDEIGDLFAENVRYRYHAYDDPIVGREAVVDSWLEDPDAPGSFDASYSCFAVDEGAAVAVGTSTYSGSDSSAARVYDNVFLPRFDDGRCSDFTEWYVKRP